MSFFFSDKIGEEEGRTGPAWQGGTSGRGEVVGKSCRRVNMMLWYKYCTHVCKCTNETC
jgi:hypothetical protein